MNKRARPKWQCAGCRGQRAASKILNFLFTEKKGFFPSKWCHVLWNKKRTFLTVHSVHTLWFVARWPNIVPMICTRGKSQNLAREFLYKTKRLKISTMEAPKSPTGSNMLPVTSGDKPTLPLTTVDKLMLPVKRPSSQLTKMNGLNSWPRKINLTLRQMCLEAKISWKSQEESNPRHPLKVSLGSKVCSTMY